MSALSELAPRHRRAVEVIGQALRSARLHHAYLVAAADGADVRAFTMAVAARLVCTSPRELDACGECPACRKLAVGSHPDVVTLAPNDKDAILIEAVRAATARLSLKASEAAIKVVRIDGADRMNTAAQNALLKTLEEPAGATCFLVGTTRPKALLLTIRSRCQQLRLGASTHDESLEALRAAGLPEALSPLLAALAGTNVERARGMVELGLETTVRALENALASPRAAEVVSAAAELGGERDKADLALAVLEVMLRDVLAVAHGAHDEVVLGGAVPSLGRADAARAAARLLELRRYAANNLNRTLALESVLLLAKGWLPRQIAPTA